MEVANLSSEIGIFALNQAKDIRNQEVLGALGMTPQTQKAQQQIDEVSMQQIVAVATGQGNNIDIKA
jgi:hypothetical protein